MKIETLKNNLSLELKESDVSKLKKFMELFVEYNSHTNLMSKNDVSVLFEKHIFDSLAFNLFLKKYLHKNKNSFSLLDIGTGGGFPSLPLSLVYENISVTALDSIAKKIQFIESVKQALNVKNINPTCSRVEDLDVSTRESLDIVTSRAVSDLNVILEYSLPFLKVGGYFVSYKSKNVDAEIEASKNALKILGGKVVDKIEYKLPLESDFTRYLVVVKKEKPTPKSYPRKNAQAKKNPL